MSFKIQKYSVWEEKQILDFVFNSSRDHSILCLSTFDSFIERIMFQYIDCLKPYKLVNASEIKSDWMNDHALNMDLFTSFGESHNYIILNSEQLTVDVQEVFLNYSNNFTKKFLLLFRNGNKSGTKFLNKLLKNKCSQALLIEEPKFWEYSKYFVFYLKSMKCSIEKNVERVSFEGKNMGPSDIAQFAISLAQGISDHGLSYEVIQGELDKESEDVFALAKMLTAKRYDSLFDSLLKISHDPDQLRSAIAFLQSHFLKIKYPITYVKENRKPTRYDLEIERVSRRWNKGEIDNVLNLLSSFETLSKRDVLAIRENLKMRLLQIKKGEQKLAYID